MRVSSLQLGLIVAGILLVAGVIVYNAWQERRIRRRISSAFRKPDDSALLKPSSHRVEPTLRSTQRSEDDADAERSDGDATDANVASTAGLAKIADDDSTWSPPIEIVDHPPVEDEVRESPVVTSYAAAPLDASGPQPDRDIECMVILQPAKPLGAGALAAGLHARMGKRLRWFGRTAPGSSWVMLHSATPGEFVELAACLLLADRNGAASHARARAARGVCATHSGGRL